MSPIDNLTSIFQKNQPIFEALGSPLRQSIMHELAKAMLSGRLITVTELSERLQLARPTVSHHLKILLDANLLLAKPSQKKIFYLPSFQTIHRLSVDLSNISQTALKKEE